MTNSRTNNVSGDMPDSPRFVVVYDDTHSLHNPTNELYDGVPTKSPETPDRIETIRESLETISEISFQSPQHFSDEDALPLHSNRYTRYVQEISETLNREEAVPSNYIHDTYAPISAGTWRASRCALNVALSAADYTKNGDVAYALCRPPGHHAGDAYMGGYCFFNNAAAAANYLSEDGSVVILDIDFHHGNGTQQLFYARRDVTYISIHANPDTNYPYTHGFANETGVTAGRGYNHNLIVEKDCGWDQYEIVLIAALELVREIQPDYLVVSLGFDGYKDDPIAGFGLDAQHYKTIAERISNLDLKTLLVQEGGYCVEAIGNLARTFCTPFLRRIES